MQDKKNGVLATRRVALRLIARRELCAQMRRSVRRSFGRALGGAAFSHRFIMAVLWTRRRLSRERARLFGAHRATSARFEQAAAPLAARARERMSVVKRSSTHLCHRERVQSAFKLAAYELRAP